MKYLAVTLALVAVAGASIAGTTIVNGKPSAQQVREHCFYVAVQEYPDWNASKVPVLDGIPACKSVPTRDRAEMRSMMSQFLVAAQMKGKKHG